MLKMGLTVQQRKALTQMVAVCRATDKTGFDFWNNALASKVRFGTQEVDVSLEDLQAFNRERFVSFNGYQMTGAVKQRAFEAVDANFETPAPTLPVPNIVQNIGAGGYGQVAHGQHIRQHIAPAGESDNARRIAELAGITAELIAVLREVLPLDEVEAAEADGRAIEATLKSDKPDADTVARNVRSLMGRAFAGVATGAELVDKGSKIAEAVEKLGPWLRHVLNAMTAK